MTDATTTHTDDRTLPSYQRDRYVSGMIAAKSRPVSALVGGETMKTAASGYWASPGRYVS